MDLVKIFSTLSASHLRAHCNDDLWLDSLYHRYSVALFTFFAILITSGQYVGSPIDCWSPSEFRSSYERYAETLCWINGTFYISQNEYEIPTEPSRRYMHRIKFYQWTSFILLLQAFLMYIPRIFWTSCNSKSGLHVHNLVRAARKYETLEGYDEKDKIMRYMITMLNDYIRYFDFLSFKFNRLLEKNHLNKRVFREENFKNGQPPPLLNNNNNHTTYPKISKNRFSTKAIIFFKKLFNILTHPYNSKNYLLFIYFAYKLLFLVNVCLQLYMLDYFIGNNFYKCGFNLVNSLVYNLEWSTLSYFPRTTLCEIYIREIGDSMHPYVIQCLLRINLFNEVIFIFVWFWLIFLLVLIVLDLARWSLTMLIRCGNQFRRDYVLNHINSIGCDYNTQEITRQNAKIHLKETMILFKNFHTFKITNDMILVFKIISNNTSSVTVGEIVNNLWIDFKYKKV